MIRYLLDTDVFIQAKNLHYGFDICPGFWDWLAQANAQGIVASVEQVKDELLDREDGLADWAKAVDKNGKFFLAQTKESVDIYKIIIKWIENNDSFKYSKSSIRKFLSKADPWLIAFAKYNGICIVTHEKAVKGQNSSKVKIPDVCAEFEVECIDPFQMLRREGVQFRL